MLSINTEQWAHTKHKVANIIQNDPTCTTDVHTYVELIGAAWAAFLTDVCQTTPSSGIVCLGFGAIYFADVWHSCKYNVCSPYCAQHHYLAEISHVCGHAGDDVISLITTFTNIFLAPMHAIQCPLSARSVPAQCPLSAHYSAHCKNTLVSQSFLFQEKKRLTLNYPNIDRFFKNAVFLQWAL